LLTTRGMFFFTSSRRHRRSKRDWSSGVCSSDLINTAGVARRGEARGADPLGGLDIARAHLRQVAGDTDLHGMGLTRSEIEEVDRSEARRVGKECRARCWRGYYNDSAQQ